MTLSRTLSILAAISFLALAAPAFAADTSGDGTTLPDICKATDAMSMGSGTMKGDTDMGMMDQAHKDLMAGMGQMDTNMAMGMAVKNIDVAFVCGMIPHHQGAIDMAKAELAHGADPWVKAFAQKVIDAQTKEISDMKAWLAKQK
jgi:uncharacterized protein (DUF305 family)